MTILTLDDEASLRDLSTYAARAKKVDPSGAMRLQASGRTLAAYVAVLAGRGLDGAGSVIGLRVAALAEPVDLDVTVSLAAVTDRLARLPGGDEFAVPPVTVHAPWTALTPPRSGWERVGSIPTAEIDEMARAGIEAIALGAPRGTGSRAVATLRERVWAELTDTTPPVTVGAAFGAHALGFTPPGESLEVYAHGRWTRLSSPVGHVLTR